MPARPGPRRRHRRGPAGGRRHRGGAGPGRHRRGRRDRRSHRPAADEAGKALAAGNLDVALAALEAARDLAAQGRRIIKAAASGRRTPATRPGALRDLVEEHLRKFPDAAFTPHQVGKVLTRSAGAVANALDKLVSLGSVEMVTDKPRTYRRAPAAPAAADAAGAPAVGAEAARSAA